MKRSFFIFSTLLTLTSFGQQWIEYQLDSTLTVSIPENFDVVDTLGHRVVRAQVDYGLIMITVQENSGQMAVNIQSESELIDYYKQYEKGFISSQAGQLRDSEILVINGLKYVRFSYGASLGVEQQIRYCMSLFVNNHTYAVTFWELEGMTNEMTSIRERLFSSVSVPTSLTLGNQMSFSYEGLPTYRISYLIGQVFGYGLVIGLIVFLGVMISRRRKKKNPPTGEGR